MRETSLAFSHRTARYFSSLAFMYVFEPGGSRVELFGDAGYLIFDPDWKPVTWSEENLEQGIIFYGSPLPAEFFLYGTPPVGDQKDGSIEKEEKEELQEVRGGS